MNANPNVNAVSPRNPTTGQIMYRAGQMLHFVTTRPFTLGQTGVAVAKGTDILFDGTKADVDGTEYTLPFLRGAVKAGWLVLAEEYDEFNPQYNMRTSANIQVTHPTNGGNPMNPQPKARLVTTESDERQVGNIRAHATQTRTANQQFVRGQTAVNVVQPGTMVQTQHGMMVVEAQDGVEVPGRTLKTAAGERAKNARTELTSEKAAEVLRQAQSVQIEAGRGITEEEMLERMDEESRAEYLAKKESIRAQYVSEPAPTPAPARPAPRKVVATVQSTKQGESSGMRFTNSVGGGTEVSDGDGEVVGTVNKVSSSDDVQVFEEGGIKFTTTNGPRRDNKVQTHPRAVEAPKAAVALDPEVCRKVAKALCPDFPDTYDFALPPRKKLARIMADFEDRPDVIRAIFAAESDEMKLLLVKEFPSVFNS